jgi:hypothetical protein
MPLDNINDVFPNATFNGTNLTIPVADLPKFNTGNDVQEGAELVYALVDKLQSVVSAAGHSSLSAGVSNTFNAIGLEMNRAYTFNAVLDLTSQIDNFDVKPDTSFVAIPDLVLSVDSTPITASKATIDGNQVELSDLTFTGDGVAIGNVATYDVAISGGANSGRLEVVWDAVDGVWVLRTVNGSTFVTESSASYTITVTTADADDVDPIPAVTAAFTLTVTA